MAATQLHIIAYDIPHNRRRTRVHKLLCGYGAWTQYSLFECWLTRKHYVALMARLHELIDPTVDTLRIYTICGSCVASTVTLGSPMPAETRTFMI